MPGSCPQVSLAEVALWFWLQDGCEISLCAMQTRSLPFAGTPASSTQFQPAGAASEGQTALSRDIQDQLCSTGSAPTPFSAGMEP